MQKQSVKNYVWIAVFGIAMGFLEAIVVVYLRELFYPYGFNFPLAPFPPNLYIIEIIREFATILMLASLGAIAGKTFPQKFAYFLYAFGIWDIVYYIALKIFLGWPASLFTWDILFLIPIVWIGPVLAPIICAVTMIALAFLLISLIEKNINFKIKSLDWTLLLLGAFIIFVSFIWNYVEFILLGNIDLKQVLAMQDFKQMQLRLSFIPQSFNWILYIIGEVLIIIAIIKLATESRKSRQLVDVNSRIKK